MVRIALATLSVAALTGVAVVNAHPINTGAEDSSYLASRAPEVDVSSGVDLVERGAFGRLGMILRPVISAAAKGGFKNAAKTTVQGHAKANNHFRRELDVQDEISELVAREDVDGLTELVERGAFGRLGSIFRPLISAAAKGGFKNAGKTVVQGHAKANNHFRRELDVEEHISELLAREDLESLSELVERGAFGRLGMILRPVISAAAKGGFKNAGKTVVQGHAKANNHFRRELDVEDLYERFFDEEDDMFERGFGEEGLDEMD